MAGLLKSSTFALALAVSASAFGQVVITENFNNDPTARGWSGVNNQSPDPDGAGALIGNDYGFKLTDDTGTAVNPPGGTATGAGEIGGVMNRAPNSFYGVNLGGPVDFNTTNMNVKGVLRQMARKGSSTLNLGWSLGITSVNNPDGGSGSPINALYVSWDDGWNGQTSGGGGTRARDGTGGSMGTQANIPNLVPLVGSPPSPESSGPTLPFEFDWNAGSGTFSYTMGDPAGGPATTSTHVLTGAQVTALGDLTHWGMWGRTNQDGLGGTGFDDAGNQLRIDDVTYTSIIPEPASLGLLSLGGLALLGRRRSNSK